jgi:hypothetical protein
MTFTRVERVRKSKDKWERIANTEANEEARWPCESVPKSYESSSTNFQHHNMHRTPFIWWEMRELR